jgi:DNA-directed RNA polymerase subunit H (RpoH/RPB5)
MAYSGFVLKIVKARNTVLEILDDLNYNVSDYNAFSVGEVSTMIKENQLDMLLTNKNEKKLYVKFHLGKTLRPNNMYDYVEDLFNIDEILNKEDDLLIISIDKANQSLEAVLKQLWVDDKIYIRVIGLKHLQFNILKHVLVPKHRVLDETEKQEIITKYNITDPSQIPNISRFSPVSLVIGLRPDNLCEIIRPSKTGIKSYFYRLCSN